MDSLIAAAGRYLASGDPLGALKLVALRDDPAALALRGIAMAQLDDLPRARDLLRRAARGFGAHEGLARARCVVAGAEVALALRELGGSPRPLATAAATLAARGDHANALHARLIGVRWSLLLGRVDEAGSALATLDARGLSPALSAVAHLVAAEIALRALRTAPARDALDRARDAAARAGVPALMAEVGEARDALDRPAARRVQAGIDVLLRLDEVEALIASGTLIVDACRHGLRIGDTWRSLARRPILFALARMLAASWPADVDRDALIAAVFRTREPDETHRARLRVELGRLRALVAPLARIEATPRGFAMVVDAALYVAVLAPPIDGEQAALLALLSDGAAWSTSALALALGASQRTVQRALVELEVEARVRSIGRARAQRWLAPPLTAHSTRFATNLLLPAAWPLP